jgi:hypothetical protein
MDGKIVYSSMLVYLIRLTFFGDLHCKILFEEVRKWNALEITRAILFEYGILVSLKEKK